MFPGWLIDWLLGHGQLLALHNSSGLFECHFLFEVSGFMFYCLFTPIGGPVKSTPTLCAEKNHSKGSVLRYKLFFSFWQFKLFYVCITVHVINVATDLFGDYKGSYLLP